MMLIVALILGTLVAIVLSGFFSGTEMGIYAVNNVSLRVDCDRGDRAARRLAPLLDRYESLVITTLVGTNIADYLAAAFVTALCLHLGAPATTAELYTTALVTPGILVFGNIVPKEQFRRNANRAMYAASLPLVMCVRVVRASGLVAALTWFSQVVLRWIDPERAAAERSLLPRARMRELLLEGAEHGGLSAFQRDTFERIMALSHMRVARVMVPRQRMAGVPVTLARDDLLRVARMAHFSRLPVHRGDSRRIVGVINVIDVLADPQRRPIAEHMRDVQRLHIGDTVPTALRKLQNAHEVLAIVCDRRGVCLGLLTIKDLVEEIVGDLEAW